MYVSLTRAETHLVVSGAFGKNNRALGEGKQADTLMLLMTRSLALDISNPEYKEGLLSVERISSISEVSLYQVSRESEQSFLERLASVRTWYEKALPAFDLRPNRYAVTELVANEEQPLPSDLPLFASDALLRDLEQDLSASFGTFVHSLCEQMVLKQDIGEARSLMPQELIQALGETGAGDCDRGCRLSCFSFFSRVGGINHEVEPYPVSAEVGFFSTLQHEAGLWRLKDRLTCWSIAAITIWSLTSRRSHTDAEVHRFQVETYMTAVRRIYQRPTKGCIVYLRDVDSIEVWEGENDDTNTL